MKKVKIKEGFLRISLLIKNNWIFIAEVFFVLLLCIVHSVSAGRYVNFFPVNGTFQNYNPVRRFLAGQIPYRDFQDYLGLGHLYTGSIFTVLFGGNYRASLIAFSFLTFGSLAALSYMVAMSVFGRKEKALAFTNILLVTLLVQPLVLKYAFAGTQEILDALTYALGTGNSARFVRGLILPLTIFLIWLGYRIYLKYENKYRWLSNKREIIISVGIGLAAGFAFVWSNDYGISCWICLCIMTFWVSICKYRKFLKSLMYTGIEFVASIVGIFLTVEVLTLGNFSTWFQSIFETGGYQSWYYNSSKSYYLYDVDFSYIMLMQAGISLAYLIKLLMYKSKRDLCRYGIPAFANMVCFCAVNEYKLLSGGNSREVALTVLFVTIGYELLHIFEGYGGKEKNGNKAIVIAAIMSLSWIVSGIKDEIVFQYFSEKEGIQVEALSGNLTELGEDLIAADEFLNGETFFATYASAQEVVNGSFQPSGIDYIIHALGDHQRESYLNSFEEGNFKYAATIKNTYTYWEDWVQRANWFFYRELYQDWHPVYANTYEVFWERNESENENLITDGFTLEVEDINEYSKKIIVRTDADVNGTADVYLDAHAEKVVGGGISSRLVFQMMIKVENTGTVYSQGGSFYESNWLRAEAREYIPIPVINGYGEVTLSSAPQRNTVLNVNAISCNRIFTVTDNYIQVGGIGTDENGRTYFSVENTVKNKNAFTDIQEIEFLGESYHIAGISENGTSLSLFIDGTRDVSVIEAGDENYLRIKRGTDE